ncbi:MAG: hypothetical protein ACP5P4_17025, partial [Steroidobacteraceae bacterium]
MSGKKTPAPVMELALEELEAILERAKAGAIREEEYTQLKALIYTFALLQEELQAKKTSLDRLRQMLFGPRSERTREVLGEGTGEPEAEATEQAGKEGSLESKGRSESAVKRPGHGRNGACAYAGAQNVKIPHLLLQRG